MKTVMMRAFLLPNAILFLCVLQANSQNVLERLCRHPSYATLDICAYFPPQNTTNTGSPTIATRLPPTFIPDEQNDPCDVNHRKWSSCSIGKYSTRRTIDSCPQKTERCDTGKFLASLLVSNLIQPAASYQSPQAPNVFPDFGGINSGPFIFPGQLVPNPSSNQPSRPSGNTQSNNPGVGGRNQFQPGGFGNNQLPTFPRLPTFNGPNPAGNNNNVPSSSGGGTNSQPSQGNPVAARGFSFQTDANQQENCFQLRDPQGNLIAGNCNKPGSGAGTRRSKRQVSSSQISQTKRDLLIMLDESASVGADRFKKIKRIAAAIVKLLCDQIKVHRDLTRVSVMSFDSTVHFHLKLYDYYRPDLTLDGRALANYIIKNINYNSNTAYRTCLNDALTYAHRVALSYANGGRRGQQDVEQDIIIITDGCANCNNNGLTPIQAVRQTTDYFISQGIHVYVIGIGLRENCQNLLRVLAQGGRCYHFFYLKEWDYDVDSFIESLENPPGDACLNVFDHPSGQCLPDINL
ncbi:unnamed protein product [Clavelina lepadiformis]|uniref:VWFA domain-containing protein n=1 Tax=Clavelina lepadiformis TaxID=159417 RepID=A0ABP0FVP1_CLALP